MGKRVIETVVEYENQPPCKTAAEMEDICCEEAPALQCCEKLTGTWTGKTSAELLEEHYPNLDNLGRDSKGRKIVIELQPRKNPCGEKVIEYDVSTGNCCDEVLTDVVFDEDATPDLLPSGGSITLYVTGGRSPYTWETTVSTTHFNNGLKRIVTDSASVTLIAEEEFCGATSVNVTDQCTTDSMLIRSDLGSWVFVSNVCPTSLKGVDYNGGETHFVSGGLGNDTAIHTSGQYKLYETLNTYGYEVTGYGCQGCETDPLTTRECFKECLGPPLCEIGEALLEVDENKPGESCLSYQDDVIFYVEEPGYWGWLNVILGNCATTPGIVKTFSSLTTSVCCGWAFRRHYLVLHPKGVAVYKWEC